MRLKPAKLAIPANDVFKNDKLGRDIPIKCLTGIYENETEPFVLAVNASFGQGKTTFVELWRAYLESRGIRSIVFNAWEHDYTGSPLACLIAELQSAFEKMAKTLPNESKDTFLATCARFKEIGGKVLKATLPIGLKMTVLNVLKLDESCKDLIADLIGKSTESTINQYAANKELFLGFKENLKTNISALSHRTKKAFFIFIDELDRCRPIFAVEVLETIKHLFDVEGIIFVLAFDDRQIRSCISNIYGADVDSCEYLRRFFDYNFFLPKADVAEFCQEMFQRFDLTDYFTDREEGHNIKACENFKAVKASVIEIVKSFSLTLREIENIFTNLSLVLRSTKGDECIYPYVIFLLLVLRLKNVEMYQKVINKRIHMEEILNYLSGEINFTEEEIFERHNSILLNFLVWLNLCLNGDSSRAGVAEFFVVLEKRYSKNNRILETVKWMSVSSERLALEWSFSQTLKILSERIDLLVQID